MWDRPSKTWTYAPALSGLVIGTLLLGIAIDRYLLPHNVPEKAAGDADADSPSQELKLDASRIQNAGIGLLKVTAGSLRDQIIAQATVAASPQGVAIIGARADGTVTSISKRLGDAVTQGESIGVIQSREAAKLAEEHDSAQSRLTRAEQAYNRQKNLLAANATSGQDYDAALSEWQVAQAELKRASSSSAASGLAHDGVSLNILSPIAGRITAAPAVLGSYVVAGTELFRVADPTRLEVQASVPSQDTQRISVGDKGMIDLPQGTVAVVVRALTPDINLQSRAATVVLLPQGDARGLQPGQLVSVRIAVAHGEASSGVLLVPTEALQKIGGDDAVFVRTKTGFREQPVTAGTESGNMTEIHSGLKPGEEIATRNAFLLKAEMQKDSAGGDD